MTTNELREAFQRFYEERGHLRVPAHSLIPPADDQTTLFIIAGMQQFKPYFLRTKEPPRDRVRQRPEVPARGRQGHRPRGGRAHRPALLVLRDDGQLLVRRLLQGRGGRLRLGVRHPGARARAGAPLGDRPRGRPGARARARTRSRSRPGSASASRPSGSCGSARTTSGRRPRRARAGSARRSSTTAARSTAAATRAAGPGHCDRYHGVLQPRLHGVRPAAGQRARAAARRRTSTPASGIERTACVLQGVGSVFDTDGFRVIMDWIERESGVAYNDSEVVAAARTACSPTTAARSRFLIAEGVEPSNEGRGYICRRLLRRAIQHGAAHRARRRLPAAGGRRRADGRRVPGAARARRPRSSASCGSRRSGSRETLARGMKVFEELAGQEAISGRGRLHARRDLRLPDRADAGARRGARPGASTSTASAS